jgi:hypothetical protein
MSCCSTPMRAPGVHKPLRTSKGTSRRPLASAPAPQVMQTAHVTAAHTSAHFSGGTPAAQFLKKSLWKLSAYVSLWVPGVVMNFTYASRNALGSYLQAGGGGAGHSTRSPCVGSCINHTHTRTQLWCACGTRGAGPPRPRNPHTLPPPPPPPSTPAFATHVSLEPPCCQQCGSEQCFAPRFHNPHAPTHLPSLLVMERVTTRAHSALRVFSPAFMPWW